MEKLEVLGKLVQAQVTGLQLPQRRSLFILGGSGGFLTWICSEDLKDLPGM